MEEETAIGAVGQSADCAQRDVVRALLRNKGRHRRAVPRAIRGWKNSKSMAVESQGLRGDISSFEPQRMACQTYPHRPGRQGAVWEGGQRTRLARRRSKSLARDDSEQKIGGVGGLAAEMERAERLGGGSRFRLG